METEAIAHALKLTAQLMELHQENPFKVKSLTNAAFRLDKTGVSVSGKSLEELEALEGIGKSIAHKILELEQSGSLRELDQLLEKTPSGVVEMLGIKGIGPKKVAQLWKELEVESPGELLYACKENRLVELKGFGAKTQDAVMKAIEFSMASKGWFHYAALEKPAADLVEQIRKKTGTDLVSVTGPLRRKSILVSGIQILIGSLLHVKEKELDIPAGVKTELIYCSPEAFQEQLFETTGSELHLQALGNWKKYFAGHPASETDLYTQMGMQYLEPELREGRNEVELAKAGKVPSLLTDQDLKGVLHNHSTWSDGMHSLEEMAVYCKELGFEYLGMCDHSQSAFYANGLKPERVLAQQEEIDKLNLKLGPLRIFKGIESDILFDGSLDYPEEILQSFDFIVASVHSVLKMDKIKATSRLIRAIENPFTTILGHPSGRLLLSREGYPLDYEKVIDACAANGVIME
ncbi:MAG TPA: helix-hairpin-helix domain-containing protein, partial [Bacteroidia bacterium]|nr:helix-hairpin-helix domain-containing protein [Bacteroidia bacterium]